VTSTASVAVGSEGAAAGLLDGKRVLITGLLTRDSIAYTVAQSVLESGGEVLLTTPPDQLHRTARTARLLVAPPEVLPLDVTNPESVETLIDLVAGRWDAVDGFVHSIAYAPRTCLGQDFLTCPWTDVSVTLHVSTYSLAVICDVASRLAPGGGGSVVALDFDARQAWPGYNWMGVAKAALEATARYAAVELGSRGIRVNLVAAGPVRSMAARGIPGFPLLLSAWDGSAPLGWSATDCQAIGSTCVGLLSDLMSSTTGEIVHVDGGRHAVAFGVPAFGASRCD